MWNDYCNNSFKSGRPAMMMAAAAAAAGYLIQTVIYRVGSSMARQTNTTGDKCC
jgi:hypothetical protein